MPPISNPNLVHITQITIFYKNQAKLPDFIDYDNKRKRLIINPSARTEVGTYPVDIVLFNMVTSLKRYYKIDIEVKASDLVTNKDKPQFNNED